MVPYSTVGHTQCSATATLQLPEDYPYFIIPTTNPVPPDFTEGKECNEDERVVCKGTSTRRELKKLPNRTGYKARKEFWR